MDEAPRCGVREAAGPRVEHGAGQPINQLMLHSGNLGFSAADSRYEDAEASCPARSLFRSTPVVNRAAVDCTAPSPVTAGAGATAFTGQDVPAREERRPRQQVRPRELAEQQQPQQDLHYQKQCQCEQQKCEAGCPVEQQRQQEIQDDDRGQQQPLMRPVEEVRQSVSGWRQLSSLTRLPSGEFKTWETFLLPTAAAALSVPMLVLVGSAPVLCMVLFILCLHNVLAAMFMMHWVCMVAVPLLYVKYVERSFDYYAHVWAVQSYRFSTQWKQSVLLFWGAAGAVYWIYRLLRRWGGSWFDTLVEDARTRALTSGLDLPFSTLLLVGFYFCTFNPIIEEWFWRIFLYREFGGAVFLYDDNRGGIFLLREPSILPSQERESDSADDSPPPQQFAAARKDVVIQAKAGGPAGGFIGSTEPYSYHELRGETELPPVAAAGDEGSSRGRPKEKAACSGSSGSRAAAAFHYRSAAPPAFTGHSRSGGVSAGQASAGAAAAAVVRNGDVPERLCSEESRAVVRPRQANLPRIVSSTSFSIRPTARADPLLIDAPSYDFVPQDCLVSPSRPRSPTDSPLAVVAQRNGIPSSNVVPPSYPLSRVSSPSVSVSRVSSTSDGGFEWLPDHRGDQENKGAAASCVGEDISGSRAVPPAPDAPVVTRVGGGLLQVDLRLSLLGQVVLSLFYASYHTVVLGFLTGFLGGCLALPLVALLGMSLILLRNSCFFGLLGGVLGHAGVDLGVVLVLGAVLKYFA